jgi:DNA-binding response OmpR family regulator
MATLTRPARRRPVLRAQTASLALAASSGRPQRPRGHAAPSRSDRPAGSAQPATARRVLIVDDEPAIRLIARVNLAASGIEVLEAGDGAAGVEIARRERPDLVLLDVMMPGLDGWEVARLLGADEATANIPIVFLTARTEQADRVQGRQLGGVAYLVKPFDPVSLGDVVAGILERVRRGERDELRREMTDRRGA